MRWKLLLTTSVAAAIIGLGLWSALTIAFFGSARALARHDSTLLASFAIPLGLSAIAGVFAYRHTARRRKTQAFLAGFLTLLFVAGAYLAASTLLPSRFYVSRISELRHAR
jgi:uncharacterized membrane protein YfcA